MGGSNDVLEHSVPNVQGAVCTNRGLQQVMLPRACCFDQHEVHCLVACQAFIYFCAWPPRLQESRQPAQQPGNSSRGNLKPFAPKTPHSVALDTTLRAKLGLPGSASFTNGPESGTGQDVDPETVRFFINLALCSTVIPQVLEDGSFVYQAASPDEEALVEGAASLGYRLVSRS